MHFSVKGEILINEIPRSSLQRRGLALAGKSGTTNEKKDVWFVGFSDKYTLGIWGGHDNNMAQSDSVYVRKMWQSIMKQSHSESNASSDMPLVDTDNLVSVNICTKCGKRAVAGLCDVSLQGNMTRYEYFASGTEPTGNCDCHVAVIICKSTGHAANNYCPDVETKVYLHEGTEGTEDASYVVPAGASVTCEEHTNIIDKWFGEDEWENFFPWNW